MTPAATEQQAAEPGAVDPRQLLGAVIGVTSDRRSDDLIATFTRRGARVMHAPTMRIVPLEQDDALLAATRAVIADPPEVLLATTGIGMRAWFETADAVGLAEDLLRALAGTQVLARGPRARGALRALGLPEHWTASSEQTAEAVDHLVAGGAGGCVRGRSVLVQLHGAASLAELEPLVAAGAVLRTVAVYRWLPPQDPAAVERLVDALAERALDAVTFTSAPGAVALLDAARERGQLDAVVAACADGLSGRGVVACAVGDVTAAPLRAAGVEPLVPQRWRLGALSRTLGTHLAAHPRQRVPTPRGELVLRARAAVLDGALLELAPAPLAVLSRLVAARGGVVGRAALLEVLPGSSDPHAVEVVVARLRAALPDAALVRTVVKRGYQLAVTATSS